MAGLQPQAGPALTAEAPIDVRDLVERHRLGELSLADVARACAAGEVDPAELRGSGLNACELGVVEATVGRLSTSGASW